MNAAPVQPIASSAAALTVERMSLGNGLRVVLLPDRRLPLVALQMSYDAGSRHEPTGRWGLAHLTEHLLYTGPARPGYAEGIELLGGVPRAVTSFDRTRYSSLLPTQYLEAGLRLEAERLAAAGSGLGESWREELETQRRVLLAERRERLASRPHDLAFERLHRLLFPPGHPYRRPPAGLSAGIRSVTWEEVTGFCRARCTAGNAVLVLAGDLPAGVGKLVEDVFGGLPRGPAHTFSIPWSVPAAAERRAVGRDHVLGGRAYLAYRVGGFGSESMYAASLLGTALAVGRSSPVRRRLVGGSGPAREVRVSLVSMRDACTLVFSAAADRGISAGRLTAELILAIEDALREGLAETGLSRARKKVLIEHYAKLQTLGYRADLAARFTAFLDRPGLLTAEPRRLAGPCHQALWELAESWRRPEDRAVLTMAAAGGEA